MVLFASKQATADLGMLVRECHLLMASRPSVIVTLTLTLITPMLTLAFYGTGLPGRAVGGAGSEWSDKRRVV